MSASARGEVAERLQVQPEVAAALAEGRPVVALESTLISHGLAYPDNLAVASASEAAVRESGAVPATIAIRDGRLLVGLSDDELETLATAERGSVMKAARPSLGVAIARGGWAATTVSATMIAAHAAGIQVFGTGGIGGVHRSAAGAGPSMDISSDLDELARTPMAVVCAGPKAILDVPNTLEVLETRGVPVVALGQAELPGFYARSAGIPAPHSVAGCRPPRPRSSRPTSDSGLGSGILVCVPVPADEALPEAEASVGGRAGQPRRGGRGHPRPGAHALAPRPHRRDHRGRSVRANTALIVNNARVAGLIAVELVARSADRR